MSNYELILNPSLDIWLGGEVEYEYEYEDEEECAPLNTRNTHSIVRAKFGRSKHPVVRAKFRLG